MSISTRTLNLILILLCVTVYAQTVQFDFINIDDPIFIVNNPHVNKGLTWKSIQWALGADLVRPSDGIDYWQPVTIISRLLDVELYGLDPAGHHATNVFLHTINVLLLFMMLHRATGDFGPSAFTAALFAVHPIHAASVAWVTERKDVLSLLFGLVTMIAWNNFQLCARRYSYVLAIAAFALSLMSKPMTIALPFLMILLLVWPARLIKDPHLIRSWARPARHIAPFCVMSLASLVITTRVQTAEFTLTDTWARISNILVSYATYLGRAFAPVRLACYEPFPLAPHTGVKVFASGLVLVVATGLAIALLRKRPYVFLGWFWFMGAMMPAIATTNEATANRFTYLPLIGIYIMMSWLGRDLLARSPSRQGLLQCISGAALVIFTTLGILETSYWRDSITVLTRAVAVTDGNYIAYRNLGIEYYTKEQYPIARKMLLASLAIVPVYGSTLLQMGRVEFKMGQPEEAERYYREAIRCQPSIAQAHYYLGEVLLLRGKLSEAATAYEAELHISPASPSARNDYGAALLALGRTDEALRQFMEALAIHPDKARIHRHIAICRLLLGQYQEWFAELLASGDLSERPPEYARIYVSDMIRHMVATDSRSILHASEAAQWAEKAGEIWIKESIQEALASP